MIKQKTLKKSVITTGIGVHTGEEVTLTLKPAPENRGIIFRRTDMVPHIDIPALSAYVGETNFCTVLIKNGIKIGTVEHVLSAMAGLGIDNAFIEVSASEIPIMDGSAWSLAQLIQSAGFEEQNASKQFLRIKECITVQEGDKWLKIEPYNGFKIDFEVTYNHPAIPAEVQQCHFDFSTSDYMKEVSKARTFGFLSDFEYLRSKNLCLGGSLDNAIVLDDSKIINEEGLRYPDELVRHKILDAIGDFYLLGAPLLGFVSGYKSGHTLNNRLVRQILSQHSAWEMVTIPLNALASS